MEYLLKYLTRKQLFYPLLTEATREPIAMLQGVMCKFKELMDAGLSNTKLDVNFEDAKQMKVKEEGFSHCYFFDTDSYNISILYLL